jgi:hypothetical protein
MHPLMHSLVQTPRAEADKEKMNHAVTGHIKTSQWWAELNQPPNRRKSCSFC